MALTVHLITYASIVIFIVAVITRFIRIQSYPLNLRWEVYPVPQEGPRALHGGSRLEETNWWEKEHKPDRWMELKFMIPEMLLIKALWEHNRKLWYRSFPFHFGLYLLTGALVALLIDAAAGIFGLQAGSVLLPVATVLAGLGLLLALVGSVGLLLMRLTDEEMGPYTNFSHYFNLVLFIAVLGLLTAAWWAAGWSLVPFRDFLASLLMGDLRHDIGAPLNALAIAAAALLLAYIPLTHMSHFFVKWFTWHKIRWDDEPNVKGGRIEKMIQQALAQPVTWSARHIGADGKKNWGDLAVEEVPDP